MRPWRCHPYIKTITRCDLLAGQPAHARHTTVQSASHSAHANDPLGYPSDRANSDNPGTYLHSFLWPGNSLLTRESRHVYTQHQPRSPQNTSSSKRSDYTPALNHSHEISPPDPPRSTLAT